MTFEEKLKHSSADAIWQEYCGFLDFSMDEYMQVQKRLLMEQIHLLAACPLGQRLFGGKVPKTVEEFRRTVPLTRFEDYADILLLKKEDMLPAAPVTWLKTTWEGGEKPAKWAPYSQAMLNTYTTNILAAMLLSTSSGKGQFKVHSGARVLYSLAPMPYATGMFPWLIAPQIRLRFLPSVREATKMSFSQQTKKGYELSLKRGMDLFFGMSSILYGASRNLVSLFSGSGRKNVLSYLAGMSPVMIWRLCSALYRCRRDNTPLLPKDLFRLDGFVCVGTDSALYKDELEAMWGRRPLELAGGTEPSCMGTETWSRNGLCFFPDACFYEFIPEDQMRRSLKDPSFQPSTYLMNELSANENYELVITVLKGGAFARYRVGDVYRCLRLKNPADGINFPQFEYVDRIPTVIDISGFTRITEREIAQVLDLSYLPVKGWFALKEYDEKNHSFLHLYVELKPEALANAAAQKQIICEHLGIYFRYYDGDYKDLKKLLGVDPLQVTLLRCGVLEQYRQKHGEAIDRINPTKESLMEILRLQGTGEGPV
ncbi:MAG: GH3 auxin-responsive promoter family protein [Pygmaiobacter massiliensis]|nr:GH3 auxin-responsive promoter family protein [Pygmaiobacter massiliensis]